MPWNEDSLEAFRYMPNEEDEWRVRAAPELPMLHGHGAERMAHIVNGEIDAHFAGLLEKTS